MLNARQRRRGQAFKAGLGLAALWAILCAPTAAIAAPSPPAEEAQELVALLRPHGAFARPDADSRRLGSVDARRPITGGRTVLPVIRRAIGADGDRWVLVRLPGRPNGLTGWIAQSRTIPLRTRWRLVISVASRRVAALHDGRWVRSFTAIVGKRSTPTPRGRFFVEERVRLRSGDVGAPFALATSARSEVLQEFAGGPGQIALHGIRNIEGRLGTAVSHGCVRLSTRAITWLIKRIRAGTPLTIR
jgi:lipoprotein-anchoring transpeptidase ErfK/SrfK